MSVGKLRGLERAAKVGAALVRLHSHGQAATATASAPATGEEVFQQQAAEIERLEKALKVQRAASAEFEHEHQEIVSEVALNTIPLTHSYIYVSSMHANLYAK